MIRISRQPRLVHSTSKHANEGFFGQSENIKMLESRACLEKMYDIGSTIGRGNFSQVFYSVRRKDDHKCALKEVYKQQLRGKWFFVENEVELMMVCSHDHICTMMDAFQTPTKYFIIFDYAESGDLFEAVKASGRLTEMDAAHIVQQIASALAYLHARKIVHRDIKPENVLLYSENTAKLCDFGLACTMLGPLYRVCGTPTYCAPEILKETGYGLSVDVWSLGVVLHVMLVGFAPFRSSDRQRLFRLITRAQLSLDLPEWRRVSRPARDLVMKMLNVCADKRPKASEISSHPWVSDLVSEPDEEE
ncbi:unnamed protein product, partial [Mesorhabditis belari]|uniref:Protein kinase domain-containing protein n=1 Tax=Mesorhabditis belari TaxID=2138241 RepID=A0AAF3EAW6_9BILA